MTLTYDRPQAWGSIDQLLGAGLASLDITPVERERAVERYQGLGAVLDDHWDGTRGENLVFTQGSFRLGTETRRVSNNEDIDIDCVAVRDLSKNSVSQEDLKQDVGRAVNAFARQLGSGQPSVTESDRCWTLSWAGMHLDILPAIPSDDPVGGGLWITDHNLWAWQHSNPVGYANWFEQRMILEMREEREILAKALQIADVPEWRVKTSLQRSVQALKRHRDIYFADRPQEKPASIIITTLAAMAYAGRGSLFDVLRDITTRMPSYLKQEGARWVLANPVEPEENFADYWSAHPERATYFFQWMEAARSDFGAIGATPGLDHIGARLQKSFGTGVSKRALESMAANLQSGRRSSSVNMIGGAGALSVAAPALVGASSIRHIKPNTFFGGPAR